MIQILIPVCVSALFVLPLPVTAQTYPSGPIELVIPLAPGDAADAAGRAMAAELSRQLKVPIVVSNAPGAGGAIGAARVISARERRLHVALFAERPAHDTSRARAACGDLRPAA